MKLILEYTLEASMELILDSVHDTLISLGIASEFGNSLWIARIRLAISSNPWQGGYRARKFEEARVRNKVA